MNTAFEHIAAVLTDKFEVPRERIVPKATLGDLDLDSLASVELHVTLQEHWGIPLAEESFTPDLTLEALAATACALLGGGAPDV